MLTAKIACSLLSYDKNTGEFRWKVSRSKLAREGDVAGTNDKGGYRVIIVGGKAYKAHRLAWLIVHGEWPRKDIDHINGVRSDNRIANLRQANRCQNNSNARISVRNTSGLKGAHLFKGKWKAQICVRGKKICLGTFDTRELAHIAYCDASQKYHGEYSRTS